LNLNDKLIHSFDDGIRVIRDRKIDGRVVFSSRSWRGSLFAGSIEEIKEKEYRADQ
jgi:hypothetical protein